MNEPFMPDRPPPAPDSQPIGRTVGAAPRTPGRALEKVNSAPDLARRHQAETSRGRLLLAAIGFCGLFAAVGAQLVRATVLEPALLRPRPVVRLPSPTETAVIRARILDRNGETLAASLPGFSLTADPEAIGSEANATRVADLLRTVYPDMNREALIARLSPHKVPGSEEAARFVYIRHDVTPQEHQRVINAGTFGIEFRNTERRIYPQGRSAVHVLGQVIDLENRGVAGAELTFDRQLRIERQPLRLSLDIRVQLALRDAVSRAIADYSGIGGAGVLLDINTGEVLGMVSLPDYDGNDPMGARFCGPEHEARNRVSNRCERYNRVINGVYEPGSTFKLLTAAMALEYGTANLNSSFDASRNITIGRFTIKDFRGQGRWLSFPEVLQHSSNLGAAHMAMSAGATRQREFLGRLGMLSSLAVELPGSRRPMAPAPSAWKEVSTMTIGYGQGIAVTPLHVVTAISALANGGTLRQPTIVAQPAGETRPGVRVISERNSDIMRRLMRLVVTDGSGKSAEVAGFFVGGKTGTAQKAGPHGRYMEGKRIAAFVGAFPMNAPRYAVYVMVDEPNPNATSHGFATAGWVAAPAARDVISRVAPVLGLVPEIDRAAQIQQTIAISIPPARPGNATRPAAAAQPATPPGQAAPARPASMAPLPPPSVIRRTATETPVRMVAAPEVPVAAR